MVSIPAGSTLGRYRIIAQLGRGGMATVFRCHDPNLDRMIAVKVLPSYHQEDPTFTARFSQEAQTVASLNHPNILQIYDFGEDKGYSYIVSEAQCTPMKPFPPRTNSTIPWRCSSLHGRSPLVISMSASKELRYSIVRKLKSWLPAVR